MTVDIEVDDETYPTPQTGEIDWAGNVRDVIIALATKLEEGPGLPTGSTVMLFGNKIDVQTQTGLRYLRAGYRNIFPDSVKSQTRPGVAGVLSGLYVTIDTAFTGISVVFTVYVNDAPTAITCTLTTGQTVASDLTHTVTIDSNDDVMVSFTPSGINSPLITTYLYATLILTVS